MDSDEDNLPVEVVPYTMGVRRKRRTFYTSGLIPVVYDVRGKNTVVSGKAYNMLGKAYDMLGEPYSTIPFFKSYFAGRMKVSEDEVYVGPGENHVVIHDNIENLLILFIIFTELQYDQSFSSIISSVGCIGINANASVGDLENNVSENTHFRTGKSVCLFFKDKRLDNMSIPLASLIKNGDSISCVQKRREIVQCFHLPRQNIENKYSISCFNTDTVGEIREAFKLTFHEDFKGLESGVDKVWFTQGKRLVKDEEMLYADAKKRKERGRLFVHVKPAESVPVTIKLNISGKEGMHHVLFVSLPVTTRQFRQEASVHTDHPPNALQLFVDNKKVRGLHLSECTGFVPNCVVTVQVKRRVCLHIALQDGIGTKDMKMEVYKLDTVCHMKEFLAKSGHHDIRDIQMTFEDKEMKDEDMIQDYRIRSGDTINVRIFQDSIHLLVRQPGQWPFYLTINNYRQCMVDQVKKYLSKKNNQSLSSMNILSQNRYLEDSETLEESGLVSGSTILLTRATESDELEYEGIKSVFFSDPGGTFQEVLAVEVAGMLFYAPDSAPIGIHKQKLLRKRTHADDFKEMMIRKIPKQQLLIQSSKSNQLATISYPPLQMTGHPASNSRPSLLAIDKVQVSSIVTQERPPNLKNSTSEPILPGYHSDPEFNTLKRFTYCKELAEGKGRLIFREQSVYEEDVSKKHADERFAVSSGVHLQSPECANTSQEAGIHRSPSLLFPTEAVQNSILQAVSLALGLDWTRLALVLGLTSKDIEALEYRHGRNLHDQALQALLLWKQRASKNATVARLKEALKDCGLALIADSIDENVKYETT